ncbi:TonB-dependent receptor [Flavivirga spongiicola]|uniref:TonB-dependent receptor n=1 Tax=Flavivirga spongiicola TaxID=421621 RepID=A0ABU7XT28_9FLAO|nr:TonB-dependent receptor [Flavivirga sp. MEBiC05379]MDO5978898.1 TonB-dependent receptor [Flavivirga sp. MEBiC05379]
MKHLFLSLFFFSTSYIVFAQDSQISGTIEDSETGETLLGATIYSKESEKGTVTNEYGFFSLTIPKGKQTLVVSYLGYQDFIQEINLSSPQKLKIQLKVDNSLLEEVVITTTTNTKSQTRSVIAGSVNLKPKDIKQIPALLGEPDITRSVLTQPGVSSVGEGTSGFNVRGGNIDQNLILLDEAPIYNSSHVWGFFSIFNADAVKDMQLYKGGIPARYGGRASSVLDIRQREGSNKQFKGEGGLGLLFSRLTLEGPIKKDKLSFLASGRRSYFDLFFPLIKSIKGNKVYFYDLNAKLSWNINENNKLFASGYFGADVMKLKFTEENDGDTQNTNSSNTNETIDFQWKNATATLRWNHIFSSKLFMNISGIYSRYNYALSSENSGGGPTGTTASNFTWKSAVENWIIKPDFTLYQNADTKIRFGVNSTLYRFTPAKVTGNEAGINTINFGTEKGLEIAPYVSYDRKWKAFSMNAGLRYSWFGNIGPYKVSFYDPSLPQTVSTITGSKTYKSNKVIKSYKGFEPRLALKYDLSDRKAIKLGYNRMFQYIHLISNTNAALPFDIWKPAGFHIKPLEVNQISAGYAYDTEDSQYNFSIDGYYKNFKNQVEYKNGADLFLNENLETQLLTSNGYSYGVELGAYKTKGKLTGNANYTYSVTKRKTTSSFASENLNNGNYYPSNYDRPHIFNLTTNYKLNKKWSAGAFFTYQTGRPTTYATGKFEIDGNQYFTYSDRNAYRLKDTHRLDLSFTYTPERNKGRKWQGSWVFGVYNAYARKNAFSVYSSLRNNQLKTFQYSVIGAPIPFITYNFKF